MDKNLDVHVFLGTVRGVIAYSNCKSDVKVEKRYSVNESKQEITCMEWGAKDNEIIVGNKGGEVYIYNIELLEFQGKIDDIEGDGPIVGIGATDDLIHIGRRNGIITTWHRKLGTKTSFKISLHPEGTMECMVFNKKTNTIAVGGERNDIKLYNMETKNLTFKAKSMGHDELNLPIPTSIRGICFFADEDDIVACATKEGYVLLYDPRIQKRPVSKFLETKASYTTIISRNKERQCLVGTTKGYLQLIDMKTSKCLKTFKSFTGGITGIYCDANYPYVVTTCLDRHLRLHNIDTKELLYKEYLKLGLSKILMKPIVKVEVKLEDAKIENPSDEEYDELFDKMETITEEDMRKNRRSKTIDKVETITNEEKGKKRKSKTIDKSKRIKRC